VDGRISGEKTARDGDRTPDSAGAACQLRTSGAHRQLSVPFGSDFRLARGQAAARLCAINLLAQAKTALGDLDKIKRCVRLGGFVNALPTFAQLPQVVNGASDLIVAVLGDAGRHSRYAVGVAELPNDAAVEVEAIFEVA
jgi:enamine deaminase RidA (YjgF/YER057c/UK114 family)